MRTARRASACYPREIGAEFLHWRAGQDETGNAYVIALKPDCPKTDDQWDRCGVYYVEPIEGSSRL
jgi:hypothetical protein